MIKSLLDSDLYKFTMQQAVCQLYPRAEAKYSFINRGDTEFPPGFCDELRKRVNDMQELELSVDEMEYLSKLPFLTPVYLDFLSGYWFDPAEVKITDTGMGGLYIDVVGPWYRTILWEVPLMALISELYFSMTGKVIDRDAAEETNRLKGRRLGLLGIMCADFGTRRRFSYKNHVDVLSDLKKEDDVYKFLVGTSNVHLAMKLGLKVIGTQAHEWYMFLAAKYGFRIANQISLERWVDVYQGDLGIALSDTFTSDDFFKAFGTKYAKLFDGVRHDSGDPLAFAEKTIKHYEKLGIDPMSKTVVFSDGLNPDSVEKIHKFCEGRIRDSYGIGTNLTNDVGATPLNMVIKMTACKPEGCDWIDTVKLSDVKGKWTGNADMIELCKKELGI